MKKHKSFFKQTTSNREYNVMQYRFRKGISCPYCNPYEGCNGGYGIPTFKRRRWRSWKYNRQTQYKS